MGNNAFGFYSDTRVSVNYERRRFESAGGKALNGLELTAIKKLISGDRYNRVLELGCGTGRLSSFALKNYEFKMCCIDRSSPMLKMAIAAGRGVYFVAADALRLPFKENIFDACISLRFCHHLDKDGLYALFQGLRHVLREEGIIIFNTTNIFSLAALGSWTNFLKNRYAAHYFLTPASVKSLIKYCGFRLLEAERILFMPSFIFRKIKNKRILRIVGLINSALEAIFPFCSSMIIWKAVFKKKEA